MICMPCSEDTRTSMSSTHMVRLCQSMMGCNSHKCEPTWSWVLLPWVWWQERTRANTRRQPWPMHWMWEMCSWLPSGEENTSVKPCMVAFILSIRIEWNPSTQMFICARESCHSHNHQLLSNQKSGNNNAPSGSCLWSSKCSARMWWCGEFHNHAQIHVAHQHLDQACEHQHEVQGLCWCWTSCDQCSTDKLGVVHPCTWRSIMFFLCLLSQWTLKTMRRCIVTNLSKWPSNFITHNFQESTETVFDLPGALLSLQSLSAFLIFSVQNFSGWRRHESQTR